MCQQCLCKGHHAALERLQKCKYTLNTHLRSTSIIPRYQHVIQSDV